MGTIFINYRRDDSQGASFSLQKTLSQEFGRRRVFIDIEGLSAGSEFDLELDRQVAACSAMIVMIGPYWLKTIDDGTRRIDNPNDFVRIEISKALQLRKPILPVLVGEAQMPAPEELPDDIRDLQRFNGRPLRFERFEADAAEIVKSLRQMIRRQAPSPWWLAGATAAGLAVGLVPGAYLGQTMPTSWGLGSGATADATGAAIAEMRTDLSEARDRLTVLNAVNAEKSDKIENLSAELLAVERAGRDTTKRHEAQLRELDRQLVAARAAAEQSRTAVEVKDAALDRANAALTGAEAAFSRLEEQHALLQTAYDDLKRDTSDAAGEIDRLRDQVRTTEQTLEQAQASYFDAVQNIRQQLEARTAETIRLRGEIDELKAALAAEKSRTAEGDGNARERIAALETQLERTNANAARVVARVAYLEAERAQMVDARKRLCDEFRALSNVLEAGLKGLDLPRFCR